MTEKNDTTQAPKRHVQLLNVDRPTRLALQREALRAGQFHRGRPNMSAGLRLMAQRLYPELFTDEAQAS